jgi:Mrp family chromosome partitioning ATPase
MENKNATAPPANANAECVGPTSQSAGKASGCAGCPNQSSCSSGAFSSPEAVAKASLEVEQLKSSLRNVSHVILVLSGKGGVGKSTLSAQLSHTLASEGFAVGLLDVDLCGPSAPRMVLGDSFIGQEIRKSPSGAWLPVYAANNLAVMSISFMLQDPDQAVVWRGPRKNALILQFLTEVDWTGDTEGLDYLIVDTPPGTTDEHISTVQYLQKAGSISGAIVVTTPEEASLSDVRKEISFCRKTGVPILGIVENMGTYQATLNDLQFTTRDGVDCTATIIQKLHESCPEAFGCIVNAEIFAPYKGGAERMATELGLPFWGRLPLDPKLLKACEEGKPFVTLHPESVASARLKDFSQNIVSILPVDMSQ